MNGPAGTDPGTAPYPIARRRVTFEGSAAPSTELGTAIPRSFRRSYHPSQEGSLRRAVEYLAASPAARTAAGAIGRAAMS
ncbi:hypothetical protein ACWFQ8_09005 [Streptomyces sp. NPDC055254]